MLGAWKRYSTTLALSSDRDFERKVLPLFRILWPTIDQAPSKKGWDAKGIDLLVFVEGSRLPCAVQCKGFVVQDIGPDQTRQVLDSITTFRKSGTQVDTYIVVHNRGGQNLQFRSQITAQLREIEASGQARRAELWCRQHLLARCKPALEKIIADRLRQKAEELRTYYTSFFLHGATYLDEVPVSESRLRFRRFEPCVKVPVATHLSPVQKLILSPTEARWTMLTGTFGSGKTTSVLHAATSQVSIPVVIECKLLPVLKNEVTSTNDLLEESLKTLQILNEFSATDASILYDLAGTTFNQMLKRPTSQYVVILDGLDENRFYSHHRGMEVLSNQLAEFHCSVVLTTRLEHLNIMFGDFSAAFQEFSSKYSPKRDARLLELQPWRVNQALALCDLVLQKLEGVERHRLKEFRDLLFEDAFYGLYGDLPSNPLMLRFILDDVIDSGVHKTTRPLLLDAWMRRKIRRDRRASERESLGDDLDIEDIVDRIMRLMEEAAGRMVHFNGDDGELEETIQGVTLNNIASSMFKGINENSVGLTLNSFLLPTGPGLTRDRSFVFAFRILQEYLLARHLNTSGKSPNTYPATVQNLYIEMTA